jgi:hypothetical protein
MTALSDLQNQVAAARARRDAVAADLARAQHAHRRVASEIAGAVRRGDQDAEAKLAEQQRGLAAQVVRHREAFAGEQATIAQLLGSLALGDPAEQIAAWSDRTPILLFPLRLETRFRGNELWVRIYPDDCQIDSFEPTLRDAEVASVTAFWIAMWRAGQVEAQQRGAWAALVGSVGSGRAAYAIGQLAPSNPADRPKKVADDNVVLVIVPSIDATPAEQTRMFTYWLAVWAADGDARLERTARDALVGDLGGARADALIAGFAPDPNGWDPPAPKTRADVVASCAVLRLPPPPVTAPGTWNRSTIAALPDRFVALLYSGGSAPRRVLGGPTRDGLAVAPDPSAAPGDQIKVTDDDLELDADLAWLAEFPKAVAAGMGIIVPLSPAEAKAGFDRLIVVGLRISSDPEVARTELETLISHQLASKAGFGLVPQGSPTNNTEAGGTPHSWVEDPDTSYNVVIGQADAYPETSDPLARRDGEWLARALGIDDAIMKRVAHAAGVDQAEARAMNIALWNATLGYGLEQMLSPVVARSDIALTRAFFTRHVSGRGPLPAVRVGNQPYGVLPAMAFSRYRSRTASQIEGRIEGRPDYLQRLHGVLARMDADWRSMAGGVAHVGAPGDAHQILLDIVGLHPGSVEYHQRYAESLEQLWNKLVLEGGWLIGGLLVAWLATRGEAILTALGADPKAKPPILSKFFYGNAALLSGPVIDDVPLSEDRPIRAYTADNRNYLAWLATASLEQIRIQDFGDKPEPTALLYLMLRHAMMLAQWDAGLRLLERHALIDPVALRSEPAFLHVQAKDNGESKFARLIAPAPVVTGSTTQPLAEYVLLPSVLFADPALEDVAEIVRALERLTATPTARLERVFAEHIDCVSYRLDAWKTGLATARLAELREQPDATGGAAQAGIYLGAFGWLEEVRPRTQPDTPVRLEGELAEVFQRPGDAPLVRDPANAGYVHAPSLNQAAAAAILKNAYRVNATPANPDAMAVNLSSSRVRQALAILEGIRNGQTLGALLGYRFERGLHDEHGLAEVDKFIYPLRQAFPLAANQLKSTRTDGTVDITLIEARNVVDGQKLVERVKQSGQASYPFGLATLPAATPDERTAIDTEVDRLLDLADALSDLTLAESVYQVVLGNFDRAAAVTTALQSGSPPPEVQIVQTPRSGLALQHRVVLHLDPGVDPTVSPSSVAMTPRATAEAPLNAWLAQHMPPPGDVGVQVTCSSPVVAGKTITVTQAQLGLQPIDLLYLGDLELEQAMAELDDRIVQHVRYGADAHPALAISIAYTEPAGTVSLFELAALVRSLRALVLHSRTLAPSDMSMPLEATGDEAATLDADQLQARLATAVSSLAAQRIVLDALATAATPLDDYAKQVSDALIATAAYGVPQTGTGQIHDDIRAIYQALQRKVADIIAAWQDRSAAYTTAIAGYAGLSNDAERYALLQRCELLVNASLTVDPPAPDFYKAALDLAHGTLDTDITALSALLAWNGSDVAAYAAAVGGIAATVAVHDVVPFDIAAQLTALTDLRAAIASRVAAVAADVAQRVGDANTAIAGLAAIAAPTDRITAILGAAKRVLGDEIVLVPQFRLSAARAAEIAQAAAGSPALVTDLVAAGRRFPVDEWLYGVARVRPKLAAWENVTVLGEAFGAPGPALVPLQFPYVANDRWAALEFDTAHASRNDRLLYTAHFAIPFSAGAAQCGFVLDDWPEIVPDDDVMSGVTFQFDRPSSAPPQTLLLAVPAALTGQWSWDELIATLTETLDAAKSRAVEPAQIDGSSYAQLLPSTVMAVTLYWITIATNLALNNRIYDRIGGA